jgi:hypothetical protein
MQSGVSMTRRRLLALLLGTWLAASSSGPALAQSDPLTSWNDFVGRVTRDGSADFVKPAARIAAFDNDGTLWCEQPIYFQLAFAFDRLAALAPQHPDWRTTQPFKGVIEHDVMATGEKGLVQIVLTSQAGTSVDDYKKIVIDWLATARHPRFKRPYTELVYQPMLELIAYLRDNGFKTFIVSGGDVEFMGAWAEKVYGIPPEQVVGSSLATRFQIRAGPPEIMQDPKFEFIDDGPGKPVGINRFIGCRPILAFGNSDGDRQMLEWTEAGAGPRFMGLVHHTDAECEYAYDRQSNVGKLEKAWDEAVKRGWTVVDMKADWRAVFAEVR